MFFVSNKKKHPHKQKAKETKENRKTEETKKEKEKGNVAALHIICENLTGYDDIV